MCKYRITRISIKGKGSRNVDETTDSLSSFRRKLAKDENVKTGDITFTYEEATD